MAYQALYRKYRPTNFDEVVGQEYIIQTLKNAIINNRIAHAYLFCGPRGTGKTSIAKIFAKMLNCEDQKHTPCGHCSNCEMVQTNSHPDIIEIDAASNNGVDEVRNLIDKVKYAPIQGKYKVYIIDEIHMMSTGAFNALLKTIEEPPKHVVFIMATTEPNKVLPTIISRCQRFDFNQVPEKQIAKQLQYVCSQENIDIEEEAIHLIATLANGGMRDALSILDQCIAYCPSNISVEDVRNIYGVLTTEDKGILFSHLYHKNIDSLILDLQSFSDKGMDLKRLTSDLITLLKNSIILDYSPNTKLISEEEKNIIEKYFLKSTLLFRTKLLDELMDTYNKYNYASNILDYLESAMLKVISESYEEKRIISENSSNSYEENIVKHDENKNLEIEYRPKNIVNSEDLSYDLVSENSEKDEKMLKNKEKSAILGENMISDVSRETLKSEEIQDSKIILNDEYILQLLVGAKKTERQIDTEKLSEKDMYMSDLEYAKYANSLRNASIFASGDNYLIIRVKDEIEAKSINELELHEGFEKFMEQLLGKAKKIFAIDQEQTSRVLNEFKERRVQGTLPEPVEVILSKSNSSTDSEESEEDQLKRLFPNIEIKQD